MKLYKQEDIERLIPQCLTIEQYLLRSQLRELQSAKDTNKQTKITQKLVEQIQASAQTDR